MLRLGFKMSLPDENILSTAVLDGIELLNIINSSFKCVFRMDFVENDPFMSLSLENFAQLFHFLRPGDLHKVLVAALRWRWECYRWRISPLRSCCCCRNLELIIS